MIDRFLASHKGPGFTTLGENGLERFALHAFLCGRLDAPALRQERMLTGQESDGFRLIVLALLSRLRDGHPRTSSVTLSREIESILAALPESTPTEFDLIAHLDCLEKARTQLVASLQSALTQLLSDPNGRIPIIGGPDRDPLPLVCHERGEFAFARWYEAEQELSKLLAQRAGAAANLDPLRMRQALNSIDALPGYALHAAQRDAVVAALDSPFLIVTGGPGTGKTTVVSRILLALTHCLDGFDAESVALCAPTGRAKARLAESIGQNLALLPKSNPFTASFIGMKASTLHSLLGARPDGSYRHDASNLLPHRVVVLDEASMVDLAMFAALLAALSPSARLLVVGDPDQLPSVDAGAVLADLVANPHLANKRVQLTQTHRHTGEISEICQIVRSGADASGFLASRTRIGEQAKSFHAGTGEVVHLGRDGLDSIVLSWLDQRFGAFLRTQWQERSGFGDAASLLESTERSRILCAVHEGAAGAQTLNRLADHWLRQNFPTEWRGRFAPGQQVILTRNLPQRDLWNGDLGVILEHEQCLVAAFAKAGNILMVPVEHLDGLESAWAITIHKSQGSEFDEILIALPDRDVAVLTRQILYTALSRARHAVYVHGDLDLVTKVVARSADRPSRLREVQPGSSTT